MASNNTNRKRNQKSKVGSHQKNNCQGQGENQNFRSLRDQVGQQQQQQQRQQQQQPQWQQATNQQKQGVKTQSQPQSKQQQQQQQQQQQHLNATFSNAKVTSQTANPDTPTQNNNTVKSRTVSSESYAKRKCNSNKCAQVQDGISKLTLHAAIFWRRQDLVESMLQNRSAPWEMDQQGNTAFITACKVGDIKIMSVLWDAAGSKMSIQHCNREGDTALHVCAGTGNEEGCRFLLSRQARVDAKNKSKDTPLHLAAKNDHVSICNVLLSSAMSSGNGPVDTLHFILEENDKGQTAICVSILHQHAQITRMLLDTLIPKDQALYLSNRLQKALSETQAASYSIAGSAIPGSQEVFLHGLLVSLSVLLICFAEGVKKNSTDFNKNPESRVDYCLSQTNIVQIIVDIASNRYVNRQIVPISCFLLIYLIEGIAEQSSIHNPDDKTAIKLSMKDEKNMATGRKFLEQFLNYNGPNELLLKMNHNIELSEPQDSVTTIAVALTVVSLVRSSLGRSWLEENRCHLTFLKEILLQNRSILSLLTTTCPLLTISYLESICGEFVKLVEVLEARDREQNLAELLWEEERDRKRRERKKQKQHQKKQTPCKETTDKNTGIQSLQIMEVSSDDELCYHLTGGCLEVGKNPESPTENKMSGNDQDSKTVPGQGISSLDCHTGNVQPQDNECTILKDESSSISIESRFTKSGQDKGEPPITLGHPNPTSHDAKQEIVRSLKCHRTDSDGSLSTAMRWADVAKLGCGVLDKGSCNIGHPALAQSGLHCDHNKVGLTNCALPADMRNKCVEFEDSNSVAEMGASECNKFDLNKPCYDMTDQCPAAADVNSEEESSTCSSTSSTESHPYPVSGSMVEQQRSLSWMADSKTRRDIQKCTSVAPNSIETEQLPSSSAGARQPSPSLGRRKRKSKQSQNVDLEKVTIRCWSPLKDKSFVHNTSSDGANHEENSTKTNSGIKSLSNASDPLALKIRPENSNTVWLSADKALGCNSKFCDKAGDSSISSIKSNSKRKDTFISVALRADAPMILPPLKLNKEMNSSKPMTCNNTSKDDYPAEMNEKFDEEMRTQVSKMTAQKRQSFSSKKSPLSGIKSGGVSVCKTNSGGIHAHSMANSNLVPNDGSSCSELSTVSIPSVPLNTVTNSSQSTPPPPGFQAIKHSVSSEGVGNIPTVDNNFENDSKTRQTVNDNRAIALSSSTKKGRVITTVLLDKVKNPPVSLQQQNKIPLLSTLAWNCGQESKILWSKMIQSKPSSATTFTESLLDKTATTTTTSGALFTSPGRGGGGVGEKNCATTQYIKNILGGNALSDHSNSKADANDDMIERDVSGNSFQNATATTFSTVLMSRMQQRNHNRDSVINTLDVMDGIPMADQRYQQSVHDLATTPATLDNVSMPCLNSCNNRGQQQYSSNPNQVLYNPRNHPVQQTSDDGTTSLTNPSSRGLMNNLRNEWVEGQSSFFNPQLFGKRQASENKTESRCTSPLVFFPEQIRDQVGSTSGANFPAFHEVRTSDFLSEMFSDPLFTDNIAINQTRQKIHYNQSNASNHSGVFVQSSEWCDVDLDYYASLYQMKFRDVLGHLPGQNRAEIRPDRQNNLTNSQGLIRFDGGFKDGRDWPGSHAVFGTNSAPGKQMDITHQRRHSLRWHRSLQKILDLLWTTRRQYGNIVLPQHIPEYSIGMAGTVLIGIGFLMDGTEVAVLIVDKSTVQISPRVVEIMSNPEMDKNYLIRCKSFSESSNVQYIAMDLYEYNLCEYLQVCLTTCNQTTATDIYTSLVWQLLQALSFLHHKLGVPHGYLAPCWVFINADGHLRLAGLGITTPSEDDIPKQQRGHVDANAHAAYDYRSTCWGPAEDVIKERAKASFFNDIRAAGKLAFFILTKGQHLFGAVAPMDTEINIMREYLSPEAFDLISPMLSPDPKTQPVVDQCLKHPMFWSSDKKFRLILIVGSDVLTEMRTGIALTGTGAPTMMEILSLIDINMVSPNWIHEVDSTVLKEMKSFRVYKNNLAELTLFVYNCCLHFDKLSSGAKEVLDDPCKYFQCLFPSLFMAIYRSLLSSDRTDRTCYKPFF